MVSLFSFPQLLFLQIPDSGTQLHDSPDDHQDVRTKQELLVAARKTFAYMCYHEHNEADGKQCNKRHVGNLKYFTTHNLLFSFRKNRYF